MTNHFQRCRQTELNEQLENLNDNYKFCKSIKHLLF